MDIDCKIVIRKERIIIEMISGVIFFSCLPGKSFTWDNLKCCVQYLFMFIISKKRKEKRSQIIRVDCMISFQFFTFRLSLSVFLIKSLSFSIRLHDL